MDYDTEVIRNKLTARWLIRKDMDRVVDIEDSSFDCPWSEDEFIDCLRQRNHIGQVAILDRGKGVFNPIVGFIIYELDRKALHILNMAVDPGYRRAGVGSFMVQLLVDKLSQQRRPEVMVEVRETNLPAQLFLSEQKFQAISVVKNSYSNTDEDAYIMRYHINGSGAPITVKPFDDYRRMR
jgi:[ribosomal protein S18]-alanine N-acetyltransferase